MAELDTSLFTQPVRIDSWVWAVRLIKTRSQSAAECKAGHVKLNGTTVKPSQQVVPGDIVTLWHEHRNIKVEVVATISKRVGAPIARTCYIDHSPPPPPKELLMSMPRRDRGAGPQRRNDANSTGCGAAGNRAAGELGWPDHACPHGGACLPVHLNRLSPAWAALMSASRCRSRAGRCAGNFPVVPVLAICSSPKAASSRSSMIRTCPGWNV